MSSPSLACLFCLLPHCPPGVCPLCSPLPSLPSLESVLSPLLCRALSSVWSRVGTPICALCPVLRGTVLSVSCPPCSEVCPPSLSPLSRDLSSLCLVPQALESVPRPFPTLQGSVPSVILDVSPTPTLCPGSVPPSLSTVLCVSSTSPASVPCPQLRNPSPYSASFALRSLSPAPPPSALLQGRVPVL